MLRVWIPSDPVLKAEEPKFPQLERARLHMIPIIGMIFMGRWHGLIPMRGSSLQRGRGVCLEFSEKFSNKIHHGKYQGPEHKKRRSEDRRFED
jgi:hypothetical protein